MFEKIIIIVFLLKSEDLNKRHFSDTNELLLRFKLPYTQKILCGDIRT